MSSKTWKDVLLGSGMPLEYSVREIMKEYDDFPIREFSYLREKPDGTQAEFSVDLHSALFSSGKETDYWLDLLIECKYRKEGTQWIFIPEDNLLHRVGSEVASLESIDAKYRLNSEAFSALFETGIVCSKGCEIVDNDKNTATIEHAISQLRYAMPNMIAQALDHQCSDDGMDAMFNTVVPIIVTTAELWSLNKGITISGIKSAERMEAVATRTNFILLRQPPDNLLESYSKGVLARALTPMVTKEIDRRFGPSSGKRAREFAERTAASDPSLFLITTLENTSALISQLLELHKAGAFIPRSDLANKP